MNEDSDLKRLQIQIINTDELNKNSKAVVDKGCQELEEELKRLEPEGKPISLTTLKTAVMNLNKKLRRRGQISVWEISTLRDQNTGNNLYLNDNAIRHQQLERRLDPKSQDLTENIKIGDTVKLKNTNEKHTAHDMYVVTKDKGDDEKKEYKKFFTL